MDEHNLGVRLIRHTQFGKGENMNRMQYLVLAGVCTLGACSNDKPPEETSGAETVATLPGVSNVEILFRGIPFDIPGVESRLIDLCKGDQSNVNSGACRFKDGEMEMIVDYGGVGGSGKLFETSATVRIAEDGSLTEVSIGNFAPALQGIAEAMAVKYGPPTQVKPNASAFEGTAEGKFYWTDAKGTLVTLDPISIRDTSGMFGGYGKLEFESAKKLAIESAKEKAKLAERVKNL